MRLTFRPQAERDLRWFTFYYGNRFPEGRRAAELRLRSTIELVLANPHAGRPMQGLSSRRLTVIKTPFVLIYSVEGDTIDILRVWDARSDPAEFDEN